MNTRSTPRRMMASLSLVAFLAVLAPHSALASCVTPPATMKAWYTMDQTSGTTAIDKVASHNGTLVNGPIWVNGRVAGGLDFDGSNDYVTVADHSDLDFGTGDFSIDAWIKTTDSSAIIVSKRSTVGSYYTGYIFMIYNGKLLLQIADANNGWYNYLSNYNVNNGLWHLVAVTVDRNNMSGGRMYVDGVLRYTFNPTNRQGSVSNSRPLQIGRTEQGESYFDGIIDEVGLFKRSLTFYEITGIYNAGALGKCKVPSIYCGDGICNGSDTCSNCSADCGPCLCSTNGICEVFEPPFCLDCQCDDDDGRICY